MNILLINHYAGSPRYGMEYRSYYLAREWVKQGHKITIVAASFSHVRSQQPKVNGSFDREMIEGIQYLWLKTPAYHGNGIHRVFNIITFVFRLYQYRKRLIREGRPDIVITSSTYPLDIFPAYRIARSVKARLVFEVHDLWPLSLIELGGMSPRHPFIILMQWAENYAYRQADVVVSMLPKAASYMIEHGMSPDKLRYVPNGIDVTEWQESTACIPVEHEQVLTNLRRAGKFLVGYTGAHGLANELDSLINAASRIDGQQVMFLLIGQGPEKKSLQEKVIGERLSNVVFLPPVSKASIPTLLGMMDVLYIGFAKKESLYQFGVSPNKLMDYVMAAKPVIFAIDAGNDLVAESGCGI
jgi:glycosyltransferase involved in cell wall biosynthesis